MKVVCAFCMLSDNREMYYYIRYYDHYQRLQCCCYGRRKVQSGVPACMVGI